MKGKVKADRLQDFLAERYSHYDENLRFSEFVADSVAEMLQNPARFNDFTKALTVEQSRSLYKTLKDKVREFIDKLIKVFNSDKEIKNLDIINDEIIFFKGMMQAINQYENVDNGKDKPYLFVPQFNKVLNVMDMAFLEQKDHAQTLLDISEGSLLSKGKPNISRTAKNENMAGKIKPSVQAVFKYAKDSKLSAGDMLRNLIDNKGRELSIQAFKETQAGRDMIKILTDQGITKGNAINMAKTLYFRGLTRKIGDSNLTPKQADAYVFYLSMLQVSHMNDGDRIKSRQNRSDYAE